MTIKKIAQYGRWDSAISAEAATAGTRTLTSPRSCPHSGRAFFLVSKADGRSTVFEVGRRPDDPPRAVLPEPWGVGTTVYEYGGSAYAVLGEGRGGQTEKPRILFSDTRDNACNVLDVDSQTVTTLVPGQPQLRYGDFAAHPAGVHACPWVLAVQEDHARPQPAEVRNYVVAIHTVTGAVVRVVEGADFYSYPRFRPVDDPALVPAYIITWRQWDHPDLPFEGVTLHRAVWSGSDAEPPLQGNSTTLVAGADRQCVAEAAWQPDGQRIVFGMEAAGAGCRQLFYVAVDRLGSAGAPQPIVLRGLQNAEFGDASWYLGCQTFVFLTPTTLVAVYTRLGTNGLVYVDMGTDTWVSLDPDVGLVEMKFDPLAALSASSFLIIGSGYTAPAAAYRVDLDLDAVRRALDGGGDGSGQDATSASRLCRTTTLFRATDQEFAPRVFSTPELLCFPGLSAAAAHSKDNDNDNADDVYGWFWPPHNPSFAAPKDTLPPLIITPHGGPTGYTAPGLHMIAQYWATRGFAYFAINYSGSAGHGRAYRDRLWARWGLLDRDDVAAAVRYLTGAAGKADPARVGIEGGSAGGYNVLQSLVGYPALFAGGICCCGVADTAALARTTHKLESRYLDWLLWPPPPRQQPPPSADEQARIHRARSPVYHAERIRAPLLLIHGDQDAVVPIQQSESIRDRIRQRPGGATEDDVDLVVLPGEGHMFVKTESLVRYLQAEAAWWDKTLLK
ncbi:peptidase s9 prolyl oligopeptidase active site domain containing protein [Niveomyces insectorum RCEF 264]|uniref:Peptidase s9 prolyl oligopeptidase active site domain containing protein n=1 Tax=Niveomyces insectorum RCEF 264 TaxID=1081102 RepID=A0A167MFK7_9HYPO|nr:peptidase s9 prolyl oligopeptidase active site domain containing protein [Niveomyces insectorum RCEF 264]